MKTALFTIVTLFFVKYLVAGTVSIDSLVNRIENKEGYSKYTAIQELLEIQDISDSLFLHYSDLMVTMSENYDNIAKSIAFQYKGKACLLISDSEGAVKAFKEALSLLQSDAANPHYLDAFLGLAESYLKLKDPKSAAYMDTIESMVNQRNENYYYAHYHRLKASSYYTIDDDYYSAVEESTKAIDYCKYDTINMFKNLLRRSKYNYYFSAYSESKKDALEVLAYEHSIPQEFVYKSYYALGRAYYGIKELELAKLYCSKAFEGAQKLGKTNMLINSCNRLGNIYLVSNAIDSALYYFDLLISEAERYNMKESMVTAMVNQANLFSVIGDLSREKYFLDQAYSTVNEIKGDNTYYYTLILTLYGNYYSNISEYEIAEQYFDTVTQFVKKRDKAFIHSGTHFYQQGCPGNEGAY